LGALPLIVDLDGTLINTDMLHESALKLFSKNPLSTLKIPFWLLKGKVVLKEKLANSRTQIDPSILPYNQKLLIWLQQQKQTGRKLILCTATHLHFATIIAKHLDLFDEVIATSVTNLSGVNKAKLLEQRFGHTGFDYVGNSKADLAVWKHARKAIVVNASPHVLKKARQYCAIEEIFLSPKPKLIIYRKVLRIHQWLKNSLLLIPILAAHQLTNFEAWLNLFIAFFSFSLCASAVYITNDLLDLESDRNHPRKCKRPFASGIVPAWKGLILGPSLLLLSLGGALFVNHLFFSCLLFYFVLTCAYSWRLKRLILVDCLTLATLYTLRIVTRFCQTLFRTGNFATSWKTKNTWSRLFYH
jgi:phosphoserine phosphatase